jgi:ornithine--oxo-acid transaminase
VVPYGDAAAVREAIDDDTVAVLLEPIQGEAGVVIPPDGFLTEVREICSAGNVLMVADEIQSGLARTGRTFACDHEDVVPDIYILGKALGGGLYPVSAIAADHAVLDVITPGSHGSTFGGNPLAAAIGREVVALLRTGEYQDRAVRLGATLTTGLESLQRHGVVTVRARGLWAGVDVDPEVASGRQLCERLMAHGVLAKDTHGSTIRLAPPLVAEESDIEFLVEALRYALLDVIP